MKKLLACIVSLSALGITFATPVISDAKMMNPELSYPMPTTVQYTFNESGVKSLIAQKNVLLQVNCNGAVILQALGFGASTKKLFSIGLEEGGYEYIFDMKNCSLRGNRVNVNYNYIKSLTEKEALASAEAFMQTAYLKDKVFYQLGKPFILYRNSNGPVYPLMREWAQTDTVLSDIEIDPDDVGTDIVPEYISFTVMYPYIINGQEVWEQYGNRVGMTLEVSADGVNSINARLLPFKAAKRNSEKLSGDDAVRMLKNGWNAPFYSATSTPITLATPQKVLVLFNMRRDNKTFLYLSSGIGLKSDVKVDQRAQQPYAMILSDYKIGNTAQ